MFCLLSASWALAVLVGILLTVEVRGCQAPTIHEGWLFMAFLALDFR